MRRQSSTQQKSPAGPPDELTQYVVQSLGRHKSENDIITYLCTEGGMNWGQAHAFIAHVKQNHTQTITRKQTPLYLALAVGAIVGGFFLMWFGVIQGWAMISPETTPIVMTARQERRVLSNTVFVLGIIPVGLVMLFGGIAALRRQLRQMR